jgi:type I restriction enzyme S subunit
MVVIQSRGIETKFLLHLLNSPLVRNQAARMATGSTFQRVNLGDIKSFKVPIPDVETQRKIGSTIDEFERKSLNEEKTLRVMKQLKKGIMQDLLTGEVRTADKAIEVLEEVKTHG